MLIVFPVVKRADRHVYYLYIWYYLYRYVVVCMPAAATADQVRNATCGSVQSVYASHAQVIDGVIHKYEEGFDGAAVFEEYEKGLQALLSAYTASSPGEHFQLAQQDSSKLMQACQSEL